MNPSQLKDQVNNLSIWKRREERAPHKPLLILLALGKLQANQSRLLPYHEVREALRNLLIEFGPVRRSYHPEQPFARLTRDGIWELNTTVDNINDRWLTEHEVYGGFNEEVFSLLSKDKALVREVAEIVLRNHFPESIHEDILTAVGLDFDTNKCRDPLFRDKILRAYEYSCAICGFNVRVGNNLIAVEAAHIKWHQAGGPDSEENGVALCSMHHKLFDRGVFTFATTRKLLVAEGAHGTSGFEDWLMRYHGKEIRLPIRTEYKPREAFIHWHVKEVFRGPARYYLG